MAQNILRNIYLDIYNAPRQSAKTLDDKIKQYRQRLGHGSIKKKGIVLVDPVNLMPINAVPSKKTEGHYKIFNKMAESVPKAKYLDLFKPKISPKKAGVPKENKAKKLIPCPEGKERNPKTGRCKKILVKK